MTRLNTFYLLVYDDTTENNIVANAASNDFTFKTAVIGGYEGATFTITAPIIDIVRWYTVFLSKHCVVFSYLGDRIYEGRLEKISVVKNGIKLSMLGYWTHAGDLLNGLLYPDTTPTSVSDIVEDAIDLSSAWSTDKYYIHNTTEDITPKDYTGESKIGDAIKDAILHGTDDVPPRQLFFQVWNHRICHLVAQPDMNTVVPKVIVKTNLAHAGSINVSITRENIFNKVQALYDSADAGPDFSAFEEDLISQGRWGVREGTINIGASTAARALLVAEMALAAYKDPVQTSSVSLPVYGLFTHHTHLPLYYIRAGDIVEIDDVDPQVTELLGLSNSMGSNTAIAIVASTSFSAKSNSLTIKPGVGNKTFDLLMTQLGMSTGSVT